MSQSDVQFPVNQQLLEAAARLKEEWRAVRDRLEKLEETRGAVTATVYERVRRDYATRFEEIQAALLAKKLEVDRECGTLYETRQKIQANLDTQKEAHEELKLRHTLGEFSEGQFSEQSAKVNEKLTKFEQLLGAINANIQRYESLFAGEEDLLAQSAPTVVTPPPEVPLTSVLPVDEPEAEALQEEDYLLEKEEGDYFEPAAHAKTGAGAETGRFTREGVSLTGGPTLAIVRGEGTGTAFPVQKVMTLGRATSNTIALKEAKVSRQHAIVRKKGAHFVIEDQQSSNGLFVNGARVTEHLLTDGDEIQIGDFVLKFQM